MVVVHFNLVVAYRIIQAYIGQLMSWLEVVIYLKISHVGCSVVPRCYYLYKPRVTVICLSSS